MTWTKEEHDAVKREVDRGGRLDNDEAHRALAEIARLTSALATANETGAMFARQIDAQKAEIEQLDRALANHKTLLASAEAGGRDAYNKLDDARAEIERLRRQADNAETEAMHAQDEFADLSKRAPAPCLDSHCEHPAHVSPGQALTRGEAHRKLLALGMSGAEAADYLDRVDAWLAYPAAVPLSVRPILAAYQRHAGAPHTITPAERAEIASASGQIGPGQTPIGRSLPADASLEARAKGAYMAFMRPAVPLSLRPWEDIAGQHPAWRDVVRAVDASRPGLSEEQIRAVVKATIEAKCAQGMADMRVCIAEHELTCAIAATLLRAARGETCPADPAREDASDGLTHRVMPDLTIACNNQRPNEGATDHPDRVTCPNCIVAQAQIAEEKKP